MPERVKRCSTVRMCLFATTVVLLLISSSLSDAQVPSSPDTSGVTDTEVRPSPDARDGTVDDRKSSCRQQGVKCKDLLKYRKRATWNIAQEALNGITLQDVIDCTCTGDTLALHANAPIQEAVMINKFIEITTMSGANQSAQFECPNSTSGIFTIDSSVVLSKIKIANCKTNSENESVPSPVSIEGCHSIRLHDVVFQNNAHDSGPATLEVREECDDDSNQSLTMTNVVFIKNAVNKSGNETKEQPIVKLSGTTYMKNITTENNTGGDAVFFASNAKVYIENLEAHGNSMSVLVAVKNSNITLERCNLENNGRVDEIDGGALKLQASNATILTSTFRKNKGRNGGVVYANGDSRISIRHSQVENSNASVGGAFWSTDSHIEMYSTNFTGNKACNDGGAVRSKNTNLTISNCTFQENSATDAGGCMKIEEGDTSITNSVMKFNNASFGAVVRSERGKLTFNFVIFTRGACYFDDDKHILLIHCSFKKNEALYGGAFYAQNITNFEMMHAALEGNEAGLIGGGASIDESKLTFLNVTCRNNNGPYGGGFHLLKVQMDASELSFTNNNASEGGAFVARNSTINVVTRKYLKWLKGPDILANEETFGMKLKRNRALDAGGGIAADGSKVTLRKCIFQKNTASEGGALQSRSSNLTIKASNFMDNRVETLGGSIYARGGDSEYASWIKLERVNISNGEALAGGGVYSLSVKLELIQCKLSGNSARQDGGAVHISNIMTSKRVSLKVYLSNFSNCEADQSGGAIFAAAQKKASMRVEILSSKLVENVARNGSGLWFRGLAVEIENTTLKRNKATEIGGGIWAKKLVSCIVKNSTITKNMANEVGGGLWVKGLKDFAIHNTDFVENDATKDGGGIRLVDSIMKSTETNFSGNKAQDGAGLSLDKTSRFACCGCNFQSNKANNKGTPQFQMRAVERALCCVGGGIDCMNNVSQVTVQCRGCVFQENVADYGAGIHFKVDGVNMCKHQNTSRGRILIDGSSFQRNVARRRGSAIHSNAKDCVRVSCSYVKSQHCIPDFVQPEGSWQIVESGRCDHWTTRDASKHLVSTYTTHVKLKIKNGGKWKGQLLKLTPTRYEMTQFVSGEVFPDFSLKAFDDYNQDRAHSSDKLKATLKNSDDTKGLLFDPREVDISTGKKELPGPKTLDVSDGTYELFITFQTEGIEDISLTVIVRPCRVGERTSESGGPTCESCGRSRFNFEYGKTTCKECHLNANCSGSFIVPKKEYWHSDPCHDKMDRCLNTKACRESQIGLKNGEICERRENDTNCTKTDRTYILLQLAKRIPLDYLDNGSCALSDDFNKNYRIALCSKGYEGVLCGSCSKGYGRTPNFKCSKCWHNAAYAAVLISAVAWMIIVVAITIRGNKIRSPDVIADLFPNRKEGPDTSCADLSEDETPAALVIGDQSNGLSYSNARKDSSETSSESDEHLALEKRVQLSKWKICEIVKVMVNFLQAVAVASLINVEWTNRVRNLLFTVDVAGGASVEAISNAVYCLSKGGKYERSIITQVTGITGPLLIAVLYAIFHLIKCIWRKERTAVFKRRTVLSLLAVLYFSYLTITKQSVMVFMSVKVHDHGPDFTHNISTPGTQSKYWAQDTAVEYNSDGHIFLIVVACFFLVSITFGFPITSAAVLQYYGQKACLGPEGPVYDRMGFLYRAFNPDIPHWESLIMARKAALSLIAVFSYYLGGVKQSLLAILVLLLALYWHAGRMPYRDEFDFINRIELCSLFVSCMVFVLACFFSEGVSGSSVREILSFFVIMPIVLFVLWICYELFFCVVEYFKAALDASGREYKGNSKLLVIWKWICYRLGLEDSNDGDEHELAALA